MGSAHSDSTLQHQIHDDSLEYADEATLLAATPAVALESRVGHAIAEDTYFLLKSASPVVWMRLDVDRAIFRDVAAHTSTTWYTLYTDGSADLLLLPADSLWLVNAYIIGLTSGAPQHWAYSLTNIVIKNDGGTTTLLDGGVKDSIVESDAVYDVQAVADDTNDALLIQVQRIAGTDYSISWLAKIEIVQVISA